MKAFLLEVRGVASVGFISLHSATAASRSQRLVVQVRVRCGDEPFEQRMRLVRLAVKFR
jgi:hypothetical protein